jgi:hypothetical protein
MRSTLAAALLIAGCSRRPPAQRSLDGGPREEDASQHSVTFTPPARADASVDNDGGIDACRGDEFCHLENSPDGQLAGSCGAVSPSETILPLRPDAGGSRLDFFAVMRSARAGRPVRLEIELFNPLEMCECPDFAFRPFNDPEARGHEVYAVFSRAGPRGHWRGIERAGPVKYVVTGYFTGRMIDHAEFWREQTGEEQGAPDEEERFAWKIRYPELCVESWCVIPDKNGNREALSDPARGDAKNYWKWIQKMRAAKVDFCEEPRRK